MNGAAQAFGFARDAHANDGADLMAGGVVGWHRGSGKQNHGNMLQPRAGLHDGAEIFAGDFLAFGLGIITGICCSRGQVFTMAQRSLPVISWPSASARITSGVSPRRMSSASCAVETATT